MMNLLDFNTKLMTNRNSEMLNREWKIDEKRQLAVQGNDERDFIRGKKLAFKK